MTVIKTDRGQPDTREVPMTWAGVALFALLAFLAMLAMSGCAVIDTKSAASLDADYAMYHSCVAPVSTLTDSQNAAVLLLGEKIGSNLHALKEAAK